MHHNVYFWLWKMEQNIGPNRRLAFNGKDGLHPKDQAKAVDIETTAYALLSLGVQKDLEGGLPVLKWVTSQRNPEGGFSSTQVIGLL